MHHRSALVALLLAPTLAHAGVFDAPTRCIAPARAGGGFDVSCQLAQKALRDAGVLKQDLSVDYMPGGIGAVAFNTVLTQRATDTQSIVAFSSGTLLNLAQGRFGNHSEVDVRWLVSIGLDFGVIAVRHDSPFTDLRQLLAEWKAHPHMIAFGGAGTIGSQDWMKAALLARAAGVGHKAMRFVAFEGGGESMAALAGGHVQAIAGDIAEVGRRIELGAPIRVLAVLADQRLPGRWSTLPTAKEQGADVRWPIVRGFYMAPRVGEAALREWSDALVRATASPGFSAERTRAGLQAHFASGAELQALIERSMSEYRALAAEFGLLRP